MTAEPAAPCKLSCRLLYNADQRGSHSECSLIVVAITSQRDYLQLVAMSASLRLTICMLNKGHLS